LRNTLIVNNKIVVNNIGSEGNCRAPAINTNAVESSLQFPGTTCGTTIPTAPSNPIVLPRDTVAKDTYGLAVQGGAIDTGLSPSCPSIDQLGVVRPFDGNHDGTPVCDIGAREDDRAVIQQPVGPTTSQPGSVTIDLTPNVPPGLTTLTTSSVGPPPPTGYREGRARVYYDLRTNARFNQAEICVSYDGRNFSDGREVRLFYYVDGSWHDKTLSVDTRANVICGRTTSLAMFAVFEANQK
jgi:hypothetical protein